MIFSKKIYNSGILLLILLTACVIRFWKYGSLPFTHDELSMLARLRFQDFSELIEKGVKPDGHPAGVQVFMWFWVKIFGWSEMSVKRPFMLMGTASVYLGYLNGKKWFSESTGLLTATYIAGLQYCITLGSQIARPYASGLFFSLFLMLFWHKIVFPKSVKKPQNTDFLFFILFSFLSCYNHHFSLLFTGIVILTGVFFYRSLPVKKYFFSVFIIAILYLPHLSVFFHQLSTGGIGWLPKPDYTFFIYYFTYLFHFSGILILWTLVVVLSGIFFYYKSRQESSVFLLQKRLVLLVWFLLPLITGYAYSVLRSPVLQASMLIFSFPCFLILLFSFHNQEKKYQFMLVSISLILCLFTLMDKRQHFQTMYHQPFRQYHAFGVHAQSSAGKTPLVILNVNPDYVRYYDTMPVKQPLIFKTLAETAGEVRQWKKVLSEIKETDLILGGVPKEYILAAQTVFPYMLRKEEGFTYEVYHLSKTPVSTNDSVELIFEQKTNTQTAVFLPDEIPFSAWIELTADVQTDSVSGQEKVRMEIWQKDKKIGERSIEVKHFAEKNTGLQTVYLTERLRHIFSPYQSRKNASVKIFWEGGNPPEFQLKITEGNPLIYGLLYNIQ